MLAHSWFLLNILVGRATGWTTQARSDRALPFWFVVKNFWPHTLIGVAVTITLYRFAPQSLPWFLPLLTGLILAIPLVEITSSLRLGEALARARVFLVPSETDCHSRPDARAAIIDPARGHQRRLRLSPSGAERPGGDGAASPPAERGSAFAGNAARAIGRAGRRCTAARDGRIYSPGLGRVIVRSRESWKLCTPRPGRASLLPCPAP